MSNVSTCYKCGITTSVKCMNPDCSHYFCPTHGDFICVDCHQQSAQQQVAAVKQQETRDNVIAVVLGILGAVLAGFIALVFAIIKAIFESI